MRLERDLEDELYDFLMDWSDEVDRGAIEDAVSWGDTAAIISELRLDDDEMLAALVALFARHVRDAFEESALGEDPDYDPSGAGVADEISAIATAAATGIIGRARETVLGVYGRGTRDGVEASFLAGSLIGLMWTLDRSAAAIQARQKDQREAGMSPSSVESLSRHAIERAVDDRIDISAATAVTSAITGGLSWSLWRVARREGGDAPYVEWVTARDELVCDQCAPLDGVVKRLGETWDEAELAEGPPLHPRCRCRLRRTHE